MNQLTKLIEQCCEEKGLPSFIVNGLIKEVENEKGTWLNTLLEWLASRPTCGEEQRKFLDERSRRIIATNANCPVRRMINEIIGNNNKPIGLCQLTRIALSGFWRTYAIIYRRSEGKTNYKNNYKEAKMNDLTLNISFIICVIVLIGMYYLQYLSRKNREAKGKNEK
jgi:hypothetical protein